MRRKLSPLTMRDRTQLKIGDRVRRQRGPQADLEQRERELREGAEAAGWTAGTIERIIAQGPAVTISPIDRYGCPSLESFPSSRLTCSLLLGWSTIYPNTRKDDPCLFSH